MRRAGGSRPGKAVRYPWSGSPTPGTGSFTTSGLDLGPVLAAAESGRPITDQRGARFWPGAIEALRATEADLLVEVTASPPADGEPGLTHMREALQRRIPVVTSNKWPVALHGAELATPARRQGVAFRAESTVIPGPRCSALWPRAWLVLCRPA
jgi:hypothetical protein